MPKQRQCRILLHHGFQLFCGGKCFSGTFLLFCFNGCFQFEKIIFDFLFYKQHQLGLYAQQIVLLETAGQFNPDTLLVYKNGRIVRNDAEKTWIVLLQRFTISPPGQIKCFRIHGFAKPEAVSCRALLCTFCIFSIAALPRSAFPRSL